MSPVGRKRRREEGVPDARGALFSAHLRPPLPSSPSRASQSPPAPPVRSFPRAPHPLRARPLGPRRGGTTHAAPPPARRANIASWHRAFAAPPARGDADPRRPAASRPRPRQSPTDARSCRPWRDLRRPLTRRCNLTLPDVWQNARTRGEADRPAQASERREGGRRARARARSGQRETRGRARRGRPDDVAQAPRSAVLGAFVRFAKRPAACMRETCHNSSMLRTRATAPRREKSGRAPP